MQLAITPNDDGLSNESQKQKNILDAYNIIFC